MSVNRTAIVAFIGAVVLWVIQTQLNHALSPWNVSVFLYGLPVSFAALRLQHQDGWKIVFLLGLWVDATAPVRFGLHACLFLAALTAIYHSRRRLPREETLVGVVFAIGCNAALYLALTLGLIWRNPSAVSMLSRLFMEIGVSSAFIILIAPWYFAFLEKSLDLFGVGLRRDQRGIL